MTAAEAPDGFGSRWRAVRGLRLHTLESLGGTMPGSTWPLAPRPTT